MPLYCQLCLTDITKLAIAFTVLTVLVAVAIVVAKTPYRQRLREKFYGSGRLI